MQDTLPEISKKPAKGRFSVNVAANVANFVVSTLLGLWFTPYLIHHLGVAAYGLIPLATTVTSYLGLFTLALNGAVGRFLTIAIEQNDNAAANRIFNTSLVGSAMIVLVLLAPTLWLSTHAQWFFNVPEGYGQQFSWLFLCTIGMFLLSTLSSAFSVSSFCRNRFDLSNAVSVVTSLVRIGVVVALFTLYVPAVWHIGAGMVAAGALTIVGSVLIWRHLTPMLKIRPRLFSTEALRHLVGTGGWMAVNQIGTLLYLSIDLIVVNKLLGPKAGGHYGAVMQWSALLRGIAGTVAGVFAPTIFTFYAHQDLSGLVRYARQAVKFLGLVIALPIGLICGLSQPLLHVWLGPEFASLAPLMSLMTIHLCVNLCVLPLFNIQIATNNVRLPGIVTCVMGVMNLGLALLLAGPVGWGMYGVAAAGAIMLTAKNLIFTPLYAARILGLGYWTFYRETIPAIVITVVLAAAGRAMSLFYSVQSWPGLIAAGMVLSCFYMAIAYFVLLSKQERAAALRMVARP
jgi:membrane protein EpsK